MLDFIWNHIEGIFLFCFAVWCGLKTLKHSNSFKGFWICLVIYGVSFALSLLGKVLPQDALKGVPAPPWYVSLLVFSTLVFIALKLLKKTPFGAWAFSNGPDPNAGRLGSAHWGSAKLADQSGHLGPNGFALGKIAKGQRFRHSGHVLTVAPTRSGKGIGAIIPALLEYPGSVIVLDVKGENYAVTSRRRRELGQEVCLVDPFGLTGGQTARFNWLDFIDPASPDCVADAATLADQLVVRSGGSEPYWDDAAANLVQGLILHVAALPDELRHIGTVRAFLTLPEDEFLLLLAQMSTSTVGFSVVARCANTFMSKAEKDRSGVLSGALRHTAFLDDPRIVSALAASDFRLSDLKAKPMTVYLVMPPDRLKTYRGFVRGFFGLALSAITRTQAQPPHKVLFMLDEFAQLGHMTQIEDGISLVSGYGAAFWLFVQDLSQLKGVYKKWQTFLANSARQFFGTTDYDTARYISESLGKQTITYQTTSSSRNTGMGKAGGSESTSQQVAARELMTPDEVMRLSPEFPLVFIQGEAPYQLQRLNYLTDPENAGQFDANPFYS